MARLIDADKLISSLNWLVESGMTGNKTKAVIKLAIQTADGQPTVDAVPLEDYRSMWQTVNKLTKAIADAESVKHGHWIEVQRIHEKDHTAICECSLCGDTVWVYDGQRAWNYCPRCGAKMDEVTDGT